MTDRNAPTPKRYRLPWYRAEDWSSLRALGASDLPATYTDWRSSAEQVEAELLRVGFAVVRVLIEPEALAAWCQHHGRTPTGTARQQFANET